MPSTSRSSRSRLISSSSSTEETSERSTSAGRWEGTAAVEGVVDLVTDSVGGAGAVRIGKVTAYIAMSRAR